MPRLERSVRALFDFPEQETTERWEPGFFGTCFFVHDGTTIMTAAHNVRKAIAQEIQLAVHIDWIEGEGYRLYGVHRWYASRCYDIAVGRLLEAVPEAEPMSIASEHLPLNEDAMSLESSQSSWRETKTGARLFHVRLSRRKGNVVEIYPDELPGPAEAEYCDLSFPGFKGASGAPVFGAAMPCVIGMVIENRESELLPAQLLRTEYPEEGVREQITYFLPQAKAITFRHLAEVLADALQEFGVPAQVEGGGA